MAGTSTWPFATAVVPTLGLRANVMIADQFAPVAKPSLAMRTVEDLRRVSLIHFDWRRVAPENPTWEVWFRAAGSPTVEPASHLLFSDESHAIQAAIAGQGAALLSLVLVRNEIANGILVQPFGPVLESYTYHLVETAGPSRYEVQVAKAWLMEEVRSELA